MSRAVACIVSRKCMVVVAGGRSLKICTAVIVAYSIMASAFTIRVCAT